MEGFGNGWREETGIWLWGVGVGDPILREARKGKDVLDCVVWKRRKKGHGWPA